MNQVKQVTSIDKAAALHFSLPFAQKYRIEHHVPETVLTQEEMTTFVYSRLQWTLEQVRPSLSGKFEEGEVDLLMDFYSHEYFHPGQYDALGQDFFGHFGEASDDYEAHLYFVIVRKLRLLNPVQRMVLADALEQAWSRGLSRGLGLGVFFATLGICLLRDVTDKVRQQLVETGDLIN